MERQIDLGAPSSVGFGRRLADTPGGGATYDRHEYEAEKRDALTKWDVKLAEMVA